ncbi:polynucleotide 5'-hydroxyl-kinase NOL9 [Culicoides brevitarsis]|uniref:polynucleotide 5'-hydroxyl-kinase NOL9 n=1 Tax=Culicoides brevitarsis TaxID=469753 RepID=UPI00307BD474
MGKVKPKVNGEEKTAFGVTRKIKKEQKPRKNWNHIFKKIYVRNGQKISMNRSNGDVAESTKPPKDDTKPDGIKKKPQEKAPETPIIENGPLGKTIRINGKKIITDPIPSTSTGITANGRGKRKWEEIPINGRLLKHRRYAVMRNGRNYDPESSLDGDEDSSDYEYMMNGEFDLSSDVHYEDSSDESDENSRDMADLMALHGMPRNGMDDSDYDEEDYCSEEESLDEEYSDDDEEQSYDSDEIESEYFSDSEEDIYGSSEDEDSDEEGDPSDYHRYEGESSDTDYDPGDEFLEDLYVARGTAVTYTNKELTSQLPFTEDTDEPQVIDITEMLANSDSNDSCPKLVPIKNGMNSSGESESSEESTPINDNPILVDDLTSSSNEDSVVSIAESSSDDAAEEDQSIHVDTRDDFYISNSLNNNSPSCLLHLKKPIFVNGVVNVELLAGNAQIFGYNLPKNGKTAQIISARGYKLINITPVESQTSENLIQTLNSLKDRFAKDELDTIRSNFDGKSHALLLLTRSKVNTKVKVVKKYTSGRYLFPEAMTIGQRNSHYLSESLLNTKIYTETTCKRPLKLLPQWKNIAAPQAGTRTLIVGGKNVGKSTFAEYLMNKSLSGTSDAHSKVLLIDLDIGQPILFVPQVVSAILVDAPILGNGVLKTCNVVKSFIFGDVNVMLSPIKYIKCVKQLLEYCETDESLKNVPWIVNTMGFQKGLGVELMAAVIKMTKPTKVVQIQHEIENFNFRNVMKADFVNNFTFNMFKEEIQDCKFASADVMYEVTELQSAMNDTEQEMPYKKQEDPSLLPAEKRTIMMLAHLTDENGEYEWITDATPYAITNPLITIASSEKIPKNRELETICGNIVYLCHAPNSSTCDNKSQFECFGIGLVRAIDVKQNVAYVHHSIPRAKMRQANMLVLANITPPKDIFLKQSNKVTSTLPNLYNTEAEFAGSRKIGRGNV